MSTLFRMMLVAITVWPTTTPIRAVIRMTSMARSRSAGVRSASSAGAGKAACLSHPGSVADRARSGACVVLPVLAA